MGAGDAVNAIVHDIKTRQEREVERWESNEAAAAASIPDDDRRDGAFGAELERREEEREAARSGRGRPRKGREARVVVSARIETSVVQAIEQSGMTVAEVMERTARCLTTGMTWEESGPRLQAAGAA